MEWTSIVIAFVCTTLVAGLAAAVVWERRSIRKLQQSAFDVLAKGVDNDPETTGD
jgi:hypothetical protein